MGQELPSAWTRLCVLELKTASLCPMEEEQFSSLGLAPITSSCGCSNEARVCKCGLPGPCNRHRVGLRGEQRRVILPVGPDHPPGFPCWRSEGGDAPRCAPHSVVAGDNPRTGIGRQRTRRSGRGPQKPRLPASCMQMLLAQSRETSAGPTTGGQRGGRGGGDRVDQHRVATMFDSSQYPYNCFNDDADDYPAGSSDEEKRLTRPAYR